MQLPIPAPAPGVIIANDTSTAAVRYPVFAAITGGQAVKEYVSNSKLYYTPSTGVLNATGFSGSGSGLTGTASSLSIGGNAATATLATTANNLAAGVANQVPYQTAAGATSYISAPTASGQFLQWTTGGGFAWSSFNGVTSFSAGTTGFTPNTSSTGAITLAGTLNAASGGTGANSLTGYVYGNGTGAMTAATTIPNTAISGLGTMSTQNANSVAVTGGSIDGTTIGSTTAAAIRGTTVTATAALSGSSNIGAGFNYGALTYSGSNIANAWCGSVNSYMQTIIQNTNSGTSASTDYIVSNNLGTDSNYYGDFGINSSNFSSGSGAFSAPNNTYLGASGGDLAIGTFGSNPIHFVINSSATDAMTINTSGAVAFNGSYGSANYLLQSNGSTAVPTWVNPAALSVSSAANITGGNSGYVPYQSATNTTGFVSPGTTGQVFTSGGTGSPTWTSQSALSVGTATNIAGGAANQVHYQTGSGATGFITAPTVANTALTWTGSAFAWSSAPVSGTANGVAYFNGSGALSSGSGLVFDGSNLGLGVTPSAWSNNTAIQLGGGSIYSYSANDRVGIVKNAYIQGSAAYYKNSDYASNYLQYGGQHLWYNAPSGTAGNAISFTQAMTLDASGNLGIGGNAASGVRLHVQSTNTQVTFQDNYTNKGSGPSTYVNFYAANARAGYIGYPGSNDFYLWNESNSNILFATNAAERMRIDSSGNLLVGTTSAAAYANGIALLPNYGASSQSLISIGHVSGTPTGQGYVIFGYNGSSAGSIAQLGTASVSYNTVSDYRLKENVQPMQNALATVSQLNPVTYDWVADKSKGQGFIAHELQAVVPDCVTGTKDAVDAEGKPVYQGIDTSFLVATLTKAIQELNATVTAQAADIAALKAKVGI